ncbi:MAG: ISL3 family transposase [Leptospirales bacterium]
MKPDSFILPGYRILQVEEADGDYTIRAETVAPPIRCIHCESESLAGFGRRGQGIRDLPVHGKRVKVFIVTRRFRCSSCGKTFYEPLPEIDDKRLMTKRLLRWLEERSLRQTFLKLGEETGISNMTVRKVFECYEQRLRQSIRFETPEVLGIGKARLIRKPRTVLTNVASGLVLGMLEDREEETVVRYLETLPDRHLVRRVIIDTWNPFLKAVEQSLPGAMVIADRSSVVNMAEDLLEEIRKTMGKTIPSDQRRIFTRSGKIRSKRFQDLSGFEKKDLSALGTSFPSLCQAYWGKERFYDFYAADSKALALALFNSWEESLDPALRKLFCPMITLFRDWQDQILNYFDHRASNDCPNVEKNLIQAEIRMGRGYSFDVLRTRILLVPHGAHRKWSLSSGAGTESMASEPFPHYGEPSTGRDTLEASLGVDTSRLLELIDQDRV